jgi:hypothetical protein
MLDGDGMESRQHKAAGARRAAAGRITCMWLDAEGATSVAPGKTET